MARTIQIQSIALSGFKNVANGSVCFKNNIVGIYGQNGSGKTAVIDALGVFKNVASGGPLPKASGDFVMCGKKLAECTITFCVLREDGEGDGSLEYEFKFGNKPQGGVEIVFEQISERKDAEAKRNILRIDRAEEKKWLAPASDWNQLVSGKENSIRIGVIREITSIEGRSFVFSKELGKFIEASDALAEKRDAITDIALFARENLFVVKNCGFGPFNIDFSFPFNFRHVENRNLSFGTLPMTLQGPNVFDKDLFDLVEKSFEEMNVVLGEIIPKLAVVVKNEGVQQTEQGKEGVRFELLSRKGDSQEIPLRYESEGVKKIISILSLLISVYNNPSAFLAVDELDAGIFEYLLGEILRILEEKAKGRLLFTSHNLRPLEMIGKESMVFTTANPSNRYIRLSGIQANNNPRSVYLRSIALGGQKEDVYVGTNSFRIDRAFRNAWKACDGQD